MADAEFDMNRSSGDIIPLGDCVAEEVSGMQLEDELQKVPDFRIMHSKINSLLRRLNQTDLALIRTDLLLKEEETPVAVVV